MSEDLNKLRELAESLQAGSAGFVRSRDFLNARHDFIDAANPAVILELFSRLQAAEERAEKLAGALKYATGALKSLRPVLTVPAAEYVPAIPDAWAIIDDAISEIENGR